MAFVIVDMAASDCISPGHCVAADCHLPPTHLALTLNLEFIVTELYKTQFIVTQNAVVQIVIILQTQK